MFWSLKWLTLWQVSSLYVFACLFLRQTKQKVIWHFFHLLPMSLRTLYVLAVKICNFILFFLLCELDDQKLRALQLNSWQLLRLLQAQLPGFPCRNFPCDAFITNSGPTITECKGSKEKLLCCLYLNAATLHDAWRAEVVVRYATILLCYVFNKFYKKYLWTFFYLPLFFRSNNTEGYHTIDAAYREFLDRASEWLSHKATDVRMIFCVKICWPF